MARTEPYQLVIRMALGLAAFMPWCAMAAERNWTDTRVAGPFVCRADFSLEQVEGLLSSLGGLQQDLIDSLGVAPADEYIEVYLFHNQSAYRAFLRHHFPDAPSRRALFIKRGGPGIVMAYQSKELAVDVRHECTHALLHAALPMVPLWLDEGLAEYFETTPAKRAYESSYLGTTRWNARLGIVPKLTKLEQLAGVEAMGGAEYRGAWSWVHFMLHGPNAARTELRLYLKDIENYSPPGKLSERLSSQIPDLRGQYLAHFRNWSE